MTTATERGAPLYRIEEGVLYQDKFIEESILPGATLPTIEVSCQPRPWHQNANFDYWRRSRCTRSMYFDSPRDAWDDYYADLIEAARYQSKVISDAENEIEYLLSEKKRVRDMIAALEEKEPRP